ncbi:MAG: AbrB/MazE/SpoVT family DNA-binding domain-containing protein [Methanomicrobia archaeon]|nr:AbrB/MazE/SpoVT family DNA-binding domain-containing protein [Methanomicrobia archaeon]
MESVIIAKTKVTSGFRVMIPKEIRDTQGIEDGMEVIWYEQDGKINVYFRKAVKSIKELRGTISGGKDLSKTGTTDLLDEELELE